MAADMSGFAGDETFGQTQIPTEAPVDLSMFKNTSTKVSNLRNQSLYVKFDPLVGNSPSPQTPVSNEVRRQTLANTMMNQADGGGKLLDLGSPMGTPTAGNAAKGQLYTEDDKNEMISQAIAQAEEEAMIVQMETEQLRKDLAVEREQNAQLTAVMEEYSREIKNLMTAKGGGSEHTAELKSLREEKGQIQEDLEKTETAFADLHTKYTKVKEVIENYKKNEGILKSALQQSQGAHQAAEDKFSALREQAESKISEANTEIASVREQNQRDLAALQMKLKSSEREANSLKRTVETKTLDNDELTQICDELVKKLENLGG